MNQTKLLIIKLLLLIFLFCSSISFTQNLQSLGIPNTLPEKVTKYFEFLISYTDGEFNRDNDTMSIDRLKRIASLINAASEEDAYLKFIYYDTLVRKTDPLWTSMLPTRDLMGLITRKIKTELPPIADILINTDYLFKAEILRAEIFKYQVHGTSFTIDKVNVTAKILDIIKGDGRFKQVDEVTFEFLPDISGYNLFIPRELCLLPLKVWGYYADTFGLSYRRNLEESISKGKFLIQNEIVIDEDNYFGLGEQVQWDTLKTYIIEKLNLIRSWGEK